MLFAFIFDVDLSTFIPKFCLAVTITDAVRGKYGLQSFITTHINLNSRLNAFLFTRVPWLRVLHMIWLNLFSPALMVSLVLYVFPQNHA